MNAGRLQPLSAPRPDAGGAEPANDLAVLGHACLLEHENLLHGDHLTFHAGDLRDAGDLAGAVAQPRLLADDLNRGRDLLAHGALREVCRAHRDHRLDTHQRIPRRVRVHGRQRAVMTRIHRLQHVERFFASHLADDNAVRTHTQRVNHELTLADGALAFDVWRSRLEARDVRLVKLQLGRVFDGDDAFFLGDESREDVQQRRLTSAGASADQHVQPGAHAVRQEVEHRPCQGAQGDQILGFQALGRKAANRQQRAVHRERRNDGVDTRTVRQACVDHRRAVVHAAADVADDAIDDPQQVTIVAECGGHTLQMSVPLDEHVLVRVDENIVDGRIPKERLERSEAEHVIHQLAEERFAFAQADWDAFFVEEVVDQRADLAFHARAVGLRERLEIQPIEQLAMDVGLQLEILLPGRRLRRPLRRRLLWPGRRRGTGSVGRARSLTRWNVARASRLLWFFSRFGWSFDRWDQRAHRLTTWTRCDQGSAGRRAC